MKDIFKNKNNILLFCLVVALLICFAIIGYLLNENNKEMVIDGTYLYGQQESEEAKYIAINIKQNEYLHYAQNKWKIKGKIEKINENCYYFTENDDKYIVFENEGKLYFVFDKDTIQEYNKISEEFLTIN